MARKRRPAPFAGLRLFPCSHRGVAHTLILMYAPHWAGKGERAHTCRTMYAPAGRSNPRLSGQASK